MSSNGTFKEHIQHTVTEAKKQCSWILRTFQTREPLLMLTLWKSLVRSRLEYCSQLWSHTQTGDIQAIEMVQRSFIRKISGCRQLNYWQQLKYLNLYSLERRRERYHIIYIWIMLENHVPNISSSDGIQDKVSAQWHPRRGRECCIRSVDRNIPRHIQNLIHASLPIRGQRLFNCLPPELRNLSGCSTDCFKRQLDLYLKTIPDEPQVPGYTAQRRADTNSLLDMSRLAETYLSPVVEEPGEPHTVTLGYSGVSSAIALA